VSVQELLVEARQQGFDERLYRDEIGRQICEVKMLRLRPLPAGLDERQHLEALERLRRTWLAELRRATYVEIRL